MGEQMVLGQGLCPCNLDGDQAADNNLASRREQWDHSVINS